MEPFGFARSEIDRKKRKRMLKAPFGYVNDVGSPPKMNKIGKAVKCFSLHWPFSIFQCFVFRFLPLLRCLSCPWLVKLNDNTVGFKC